MTNDLQIDALLPAEMAAKAEAIGVKKAHLDLARMFALAVLAGAFVALGSIFATTVGAAVFGSTLTDGGGASTSWPTGFQRLLVGLVFSLGLILVVICGAELFTGNNLIVMAWANGQVGTRLLGLNWLVVYTGNFVGSVAAHRGFRPQSSVEAVALSTWVCSKPAVETLHCNVSTWRAMQPILNTPYRHGHLEVRWC